MDKFKEMNKIIAFLKNNGWKEESPHSDMVFNYDTEYSGNFSSAKTYDSGIDYVSPVVVISHTGKGCSDNYYSFFHKHNYGIDIEKSTGEIIVIADVGDIFHIQLSHESIYTLIGFLIINPCDDICLKYNLKGVDNAK